MRLIPAAAILLLTPLLATLLATPAAADPGPPGQVRTDQGVVQGVVLKDRREFKGIPYAEPPVGALRWKAPRPARPWRGVRDATAFASQCAQPASPFGNPQATYAEDCLYLNVTTPRRAGRLPVMVWLHGGGNVNGNSAPYDGAKLAVDGGVVVVTVNYRLGVLGWLAHPVLEAGERYQSGNYGLLDQQAALRWVRRNIAAFGGDPGNVTLFGESAGAADTCAHLASPTAAGLFHRAIAQSYSCAWPTRTETEAETAGAAFAAAVGCSDAACLRTLPVKTLLESYQEPNPYAVAGADAVLPAQPRDAIASGRYNRMPVVHGNTLDEMRLFISLQYPQPITEQQYEGFVRETYGADAAAVLGRYPAADYPDLRIAIATLLTDFATPLATCGHLDALGLFARSGVPVYGYQFADRSAPPLVDVPGFEEGAYHASELEYLFPGLLPGSGLNAEQRRLSDAMVGFWTSFAATGRPQAGWPRFRSPGDVLSLASGAIRTVNTAKASNCAFWASLGTAPEPGRTAVSSGRG
ncbi:carboxylesterase [[Actinomadura] parvosata subsp. kistnae]|uniref:carboxylesterase/lipase family protein n=1 Tax=[Actinomadura] parvosata TaxID=1955412 RepID=UPI000D2DD239|nr:carboxylesterase family protein [Nonomuraea sp. ATCC 55076]SPL88927.1 carboxylesterase [Actinomadura parvosata subsp. kistnae]